MSVVSRLRQRHDLSLVAGLAAASLCIFSDTVAATLTYVRGIEAAYGLQLLPGLVILASAFSIQQAHKYRQTRVEAVEQARRADAAKATAAQTEALVGFGHALAAALDRTAHHSVYDVIARETPELIPDREVWVLTRDSEQKWTSLVAVGGSSPTERERAARVAVGETDRPSGSEPPYACFPLVVGDTAFGALGVGTTPPLTDHQHRVLGATASLMAAALKNADLVRQTRLAGMRDQLTGFFNQAHTLELLEAEMRRARRSGHPLSVVMLDLDGLKAANDTRGHLCGDALITSASAAISSSLRGSDVKGRYGGDEFVVILPETPAEGAEQVAEGLRQGIAAQHVAWNGQRVSITASLGVTTWTREDQDPAMIIARVDAALLRAKELGRNVAVSSRVGVLRRRPTSSPLSSSTIET